jgi:hypothetical protein
VTAPVEVPNAVGDQGGDRRDQAGHGRQYGIDDGADSEGAEDVRRSARVVGEPGQQQRAEGRAGLDCAEQQPVVLRVEVQVLPGEDDEQGAVAPADRAARSWPAARARSSR